MSFYRLIGHRKKGTIEINHNKISAMEPNKI